MNINVIVENVVSLFGQQAPHRYTVEVSGGQDGEQDRGIVLLPLDPKIKRAAIQRHFDRARSEILSNLKDHVDGAHMLHDEEKQGPVPNGAWGHHWIDHPEDEGQNLHFLHRFAPVK